MLQLYEICEYEITIRYDEFHHNSPTWYFDEYQDVDTFRNEDKTRRKKLKTYCYQPLDLYYCPKNQSNITNRIVYRNDFILYIYYL